MVNLDGFWASLAALVALIVFLASCSSFWWGQMVKTTSLDRVSDHFEVMLKLCYGYVRAMLSPFFVNRHCFYQKTVV